MQDHPVTQFIVAGLGAVAFILLAKVAVSKLPDSGIPGTVKAVVASI